MYAVSLVRVIVIKFPKKFLAVLPQATSFSLSQGMALPLNSWKRLTDTVSLWLPFASSWKKCQCFLCSLSLAQQLERCVAVGCRSGGVKIPLHLWQPVAPAGKALVDPGLNVLSFAILSASSNNFKCF